jgi:uncharacterized membrane protein HdeD (DUF308 family)
MNELTAAADALRTVIRRTWWIPLVQGIAALVVGVSLLTRPAPTLVLLTIFLGAYWFVGGIFDTVGAVSRRDSDRHWLLALVSGLLSIFVGLLLLGRPILGFVLTSLTVVTFIAMGAILSGIFSVVWAVRVLREIKGEGWIILLGLLSILLGVMLLSSPFLSAVALIQVTALLAVVGGIAAIVNAFRLRSVVA